MDDAAEALLGLRDCDSVNDVPEENLRDNIARVSPLLDAVSKDMAFEVNTDTTGKRKRRRIKKKVNAVNEIQSMHQMELNTGNAEEIMAPTNGILGATDSPTEYSVPDLEIPEQPRLDILPKENGSGVNAGTTKKKKRNKKFMGSSEDLAEVKALVNGLSGASHDTSDYHVATDEPEDSLPHKDVPQLEIAEQPRLDVVPKEHCSEGNTDTTKKKKRKKKVAVIGEVQCIYEMEKNMGSTENLVGIKAQMSDNVGASDNASDYNVIVSNESEKNLPDKDVPLKLFEQLEMDVVPIEITPECSAGKTKKRRRKKETAIDEMQCMDEIVKNLSSNNSAPILEPCEQTKIDYVLKENTFDMDPTKKRKRKRKVTVNKAECMDEMGTDMCTTENHMEIKSQVNDNLGASGYSSDNHVVSNEPEKIIPSKDIPMLELPEQRKLEVSKENASDMDNTKKMVPVITESQYMDQTGMNMASTEAVMEIKAHMGDDLGASDNISDYHLVKNEPEKNLSDKDLPLLELSEKPKLEVSKENASMCGTDITKKKMQEDKVNIVDENHEVQDMLQPEVNAGITEDHMEIKVSDNMNDYHVVNKEPEKNLPDKEVSTVEPVKHPELDAYVVVDASKETMGTKKKKKRKKRVNVLNEIENMEQTLLHAVTTENITEIIDQKNSTPEPSNGARDYNSINVELENNIVGKVLSTVPVTEHSSMGPASTGNHSENADTGRKRKRKGKRKGKKAGVMNEVPTMDQQITRNIAEMKDRMDHTVVNIESERNLINGTVQPLSEHTKLDAVLTESALEGNTETRKRKRNKRKKVKDMNEFQSMTQLEMNAGTSENIAGNRIEDHVEPADKIRKWVSRNTERSVARMNNKLKKMNPSDAMYKILLSDEEPVDAMFKILLPEPPTCLPSAMTEENDELENGINELKNEKCLTEGLGKLMLVNPIKRKLIVLDVNGLLADVVMPAPKDCRGDVHILRRAIFKRPFCDDFLNFCFQNFDVGIWSSRSKVIIDRIVDYLLGSLKDNLLFCWNMLHATETGSKTLDNVHKPLVCKELRKIWEHFEGYDESNTLLLDDSPYKALLNPLHTAIFPSSFHYGDKNDNSLGPGGDLRVYLEGLLSSDNVQSYVEQNPFGQGAINEADPSWEFYSSVLQTVTSRSQSRHTT